MEPFTFGLVTALLALAWYFLVKPLRYWKDRGVPQTKPWLLFGDAWVSLFKRNSTSGFLKSIYDLVPGSRYVGLYSFNQPILMIRDPELIKQLAIKEFEHFSDHADLVDPDSDPLWGKNLFALKGERWREMRQVMSPTFTSSKVKTLYKLITEKAEHFTTFFQNQAAQGVTEMELKDAFSRFTNDVIASTAFGFDVDSLNNRDNEFFQTGKKISNFSGFLAAIKFIALQFFPFITNMLGLKFFDDQTRNYFTGVIKSNIKARQENHITRPDIVNTLMEASSEIETSEYRTAKHQVQISYDDIASQGIVFFFAGFETVSTALSMTVYELATNTHIQDRLRDEIRQKAKNGKISYEDLQEMQYLDMVISEGMRKWPAVPFLDRVCTKPYTIKPVRDGETPVSIPRGMEVWFPVYPLHRDPAYFPDPEKFDPERFSPENKSKLMAAYVYHPFGFGPRLCIGNRLALIEIKALLFNLLLKFEIFTIAKSKPLVLGTDIQVGIAGGEYWVGFKPVKN